MEKNGWNYLDSMEILMDERGKKNEYKKMNTNEKFDRKNLFNLKFPLNSNNLTGKN